MIAVSVRGVDLLSIVALALAILAFTIQIIVFAIQAADAASASRRSLELHAQLTSLLSEVRERTGSTQKSVDSINERLLEAIIGKKIGKSRPGDLIGGSEDFAEEVVAEYVRAAETVAEPRRRPVTNTFAPPLPDEEAASLQAEMKRWPSDAEAPEIIESLGQMNDEEAIDVIRLAKDALTYTRPRSFAGPGLPTIEESLVEQGIAEKLPGWKLFVLTPKGRRLGRLFTPKGDLPPVFGDVAERRDRLIAAHTGRYEQTTNYRDTDA